MIASWLRLPIIPRAILAGIFVMTLATVPCSFLLRANLIHTPSVPWSVPVVMMYLLFYWHYLNGNGWPRATAELRRVRLRAHSIPGRLWRWSLLAGGVAWAGLIALRILTDTLFNLPQPLLPAVSSNRPLMVIAYVFGVSVLAGVAEEAGCRGYMQQPIERARGPAVAIAIVGVVFWLSHFNTFSGHWPLFLARGWFYLAASVVFGVVAYLSGSILPGVVLHSVANLAGFCLLWWLNTARPPFFTDRFPLILCLSFLTVVCAVVAGWAFRMLALARRAAHTGTVSSLKL